MADMPKHEKEALLDELRRSHREVAALLESMTGNQDWQPEPAEWSFRFIAAHLATVESEYHMPRVTRIASGEHPHFDYYSDSGMDYSGQEMGDSLRLWAQSRQRLVEIVSELPENRLQFTGTQAVVGTISLKDVLDDIVAEDKGDIVGYAMGRIDQRPPIYDETVREWGDTIAQDVGWFKGDMDE